MNGFYIAYLTGAAGNGLVLLALKDSVVAGVDIMGIPYDGSLRKSENGSFVCSISYTVPAGVPLVTGGSAPASTKIDLEFELPANFSNEGVVVPIKTPLGPINASFSKVRDLDL